MRRATVAITDATTGETATFIEPDWEPISAYMWRDGNYSCDCNRGLFFERAKGGNPELFAFDCGDVRFSVVITDAATGEVLFVDDAER